MTEATQRPWAHKSSAWGHPQIAGANGKRIVESLTRPADKEFGFTDEARANTELIVKAVNNHDALVAALEAAYDQLPCVCGDNFETCDCAVAKVTAALSEQVK